MAASAPRVVVIGGGLAGVAAALTAARALPRAQVVVLEKEHQLGGNSMLANSGINALTLEQGDSAAAFKTDTLKSGGGLSRPELVDVLVDSSLDALQWLQSVGVDLSAVSQLGGQSFARTHSPASGPAVGQAIMDAPQQRMLQMANVVVCTGIKADRLSPSTGGAWRVDTSQAPAALSGKDRDAGGIEGSEFCPQEMEGQPYQQAQEQGQGQQQEQEQEAHAVVLATGGFAASQRMLQCYAPQAAGLGTTNGPYAAGDGLELGSQAGAGLVDLNWVQLNPTGIVDPSCPESGTRTVAPEKLRGLGAILLDGRGRRFVNELGSRDQVAGAILGQPNKQAILLLGSQTAEKFGAALDLYLSSQLMSRAESVQQLTQQAGLPAGALEAELAAYNQAAAAGKDPFGKAAFPATIDTSQPLFWTRVTPVAHYCMGGLAINTRAQVLDGAGQPIPGLFAAGEVAGGVHGRNLLVGNSLLECVVFGRIAGESAAEHAGQLQGSTSNA